MNTIMGKKAVKRLPSIVAVFLVVTCLIFSFAPIANAATQYSVFVLVRIVAYTGGSSSGSLSGHACLIVYNESTIPITIGHMTVGVNDYITIGTFGNRSAHEGIWYNIEAANMTAISASDFAQTCYGITTLSQISTLNSAINGSDEWTLTKNCAYFAKHCWNAVAPTSLQLSGGTPSALRSSILSHGGTSANLPTTNKPSSTIAYQTNSGYIYCPSGINAG